MAYTGVFFGGQAVSPGEWSTRATYNRPKTKASLLLYGFLVFLSSLFG